MSNGDVYFIFSTATFEIYNVFLQKVRIQLSIYSAASKMIFKHIKKEK